MNKKAVEGIRMMTFILASLMVSVLIIVFFAIMVPRLMVGSVEDVIAKDVGLVIMTMSASPYDMTYSYDKNTEKYEVQIYEDRVQVRSAEGSGSYEYLPMKGIIIKNSILSNVLSIPVNLKNKEMSFSNERYDYSDICATISMTFDENYLNLKIVVSSDAQGESKNKLNQIKQLIEQRTSEANSKIRITDDNEDLIILLKDSSSDVSRINYYENLQDKKTSWFYRTSCYVQSSLKNKYANIYGQTKLESQSTDHTITIDFGNTLTKKTDSDVNIVDIQLVSSELYKAIKLGIND